MEISLITQADSGGQVNIFKEYNISHTMDAGSFLGVKQLVCVADHPHPSKHWGHKSVDLQLYSTPGPQFLARGSTLAL